MCDHATETEVINSTKDLISKRKMFTAWDVTRIVRDKLSNNVPNREVKKVVHSLFFTQQMDDYQRATVPVASADPQAPPFVYHPPELDPTVYDPISNLPNSGSGSTQATPVISATPVTIDPDDDDIAIGSFVMLARQGDGFVRIPAAYMRAIGAKPHDRVGVIRSINGVTVCTKNSMFDNQKTDERNNLRVYPNNLVDLKSKVKVTVTTNTLLELT